MRLHLSLTERMKLEAWRREAKAADHLLDSDRLGHIEEQVSQWPAVRELDADAKFFEVFELFDSEAQEVGVQVWRGLAHWLWLRHGSVHGFFFTPEGEVILQLRAMTVHDSPGSIDASFAGHMGTSRLRARSRSDGPQALESEALGEASIDLLPGSEHVVDFTDLEPIARYDYVEPPRPKDEFYNAEIRHLFAIRLTDQALEEMWPLDREVESFLVLSLGEARELARSPRAASALRVSGPLAFDHASKAWGFETT